MWTVCTVACRFSKGLCTGVDLVQVVLNLRRGFKKCVDSVFRRMMLEICSSYPFNGMHR